MNRREYHRRYRKKNAKRIRKVASKWRDNNRAAYAAKKREYYLKHRDAILARMKQRRIEQILKELGE